MIQRKKRRTGVITGLFLSLALVASACAPTAEPEFGDLGGVVVPPEGGVRIAALQAISGSVANLGADQVRAIQIAIDDFGSIEGHDVFLSVEDDLCLSAGGTTGASRIVSDPQIIGVIGTSCSGAAVPASELITGAGRVMISGSNTAPGLTSTGNLEGNPVRGENWHDGYFRISHNDEYQGDGAGTFMSEFLGATKAAFIHDGDPYTEGLATQAQAAFERAGGESVFFTGVSKDETDVRPVLTEVAAQDPDVLFIPIFQPLGDFVAQQAQEVAGFEDIVLMGADGLLSATYVNQPYTEGMFFSGPAREPAQKAAYDELVAKYEAAFNEKPVQAFHAHSYDAATLLLTKIAEVAEPQDDGSLFIDLRALRDALYATEGFQGLTGVITCNEFGDCASPRIGVYQNTDPAAGIFSMLGNQVWP